LELGKIQETRGKREETGDRRQETRGKRQETGDKRQEARDKRQGSVISTILNTKY